MSVLIGLHIKRTLENNADVTSHIANRVFPIVVPQGVETYPFICYDISGSSGEATKDGTIDDVASVSMSVVAKTYEEAIILGNLVRYAFDGKEATYKEFSVTECKNIVYNDEYIPDIDAYAMNISMDFLTVDF